MAGSMKEHFKRDGHTHVKLCPGFVLWQHQLQKLPAAALPCPVSECSLAQVSDGHRAILFCPNSLHNKTRSL